MNTIISFAASKARMTILLVIMTMGFGLYSYLTLPKEGEPDIQIPFIFVSVPAYGISAEDSEQLIVKPLETRLSGIEGLKSLRSTAAEGHGGIALEFDFDWNRSEVLADIRDEMTQAESLLPDIVDGYTINEINFSEFPIAVVSISGDVPEKVLVEAAKELQDDILGLKEVLEADLTGGRDQMLEVEIDNSALESYNMTALELMSVIQNNNQLIAAGSIETGSGKFAIKIPSSFDNITDVYNLPVRVNGDRVIKLGELAKVRLTYEDQEAYSRFNGQNTLAIQIVKRKGENVIDAIDNIKKRIEITRGTWDESKRANIHTELTMDQSKDVEGMVQQLEGSVITAIILVMIAVLSALGLRSALLVGFSIPASFLLTFVLLNILGITISNIVMFGLILAVGMLVDNAIVIVEFADQDIKHGAGPMAAYTHAAKRMAWPVISSTATTLCAFLPLLAAPGIAGQFMSNLPKTIIFVLSASLIVAFTFLPVIGGVIGRMSRRFDLWSDKLRAKLDKPKLVALIVLLLFAAFFSLQITFRASAFLGVTVLIFALIGISIVSTAIRQKTVVVLEEQAYERSRFGHFLYNIISSPWKSILTLIITFMIVVGMPIFFFAKGKGFEFFPPSEPERANIYVQARGNLSLEEVDRLVRQVEDKIQAIDGVKTIFAFAGNGGLNQNTGGGEAPLDTIGTIQIELDDWQERYEWPNGQGRGDVILSQIEEASRSIPGIAVTSLDLARGPAGAKPINLRFTGDDFDALDEAITKTREHMQSLGTIIDIEDSRPLPGIDYRVNIDVTEAGRYGASVSTVGTMIRLATNGVTLGTMRLEGSEDEIDIKARLPKEERLISTIETLRIQTATGLVPISNFTTVTPQPARAIISRYDQERYYTLSAAVADGINPNSQLERVLEWLDAGNLPKGVDYEISGDFADQAEFGQFLMIGFIISLGLMLVILLIQFNSVYYSFLILSAVIFSTAGVFIGIYIMGQPFYSVMTGVGVLALAGIIVNNNIILIDAFNELHQEHPFLEAVVRTAEGRIRPILLTTGTTILGVVPMMLGFSVDFINGGYSIDAPTSIWWKPLATSLVWGLGFATILTLIVTPVMITLRYWVLVKILKRDPDPQV